MNSIAAQVRPKRSRTGILNVSYSSDWEPTPMQSIRPREMLSSRAMSSATRIGSWNGRQSMDRPSRSRSVFAAKGPMTSIGDRQGVRGRGGGLLIGVDLKKDPMTLNRAYNDALCITAAFNLNILGRLNRELRANFAL